MTAIVAGHSVCSLCLSCCARACVTSLTVTLIEFCRTRAGISCRQRDSYFSRLAQLIHQTYITNQKKVVLLAHSMGNKTVHYFLHWVLEFYAARPGKQ